MIYTIDNNGTPILSGGGNQASITKVGTELKEQEVNLTITSDEIDYILKIGYTSINSTTHTFKTPFPNNCLICICNPHINNDNETPLNWNRSYLTGYTKDHFTTANTLGFTESEKNLSYIAVGN